MAGPPVGGVSMKDKIKSVFVGSCLALGMMSSLAFASSDDSRVETTSVPAILQNLDTIDSAMAAQDQRLAGLSDKDKQDLMAEQTKVRKLLTGKGTLDELSSSDRHSAFNSLEMIHGIVNGTREERVICRSEHTVGTHRRKTNCMTASQRQQAREFALKMMSAKGFLLPPSE